MTNVIEKTIKIKFSQTTEKEREVALPFFTKNTVAAFMVFSQDQALRVMYYNNNGIENVHSSLALYGNYDLSTREEFLELFNVVHKHQAELVDSILNEGGAE